MVMDTHGGHGNRWTCAAAMRNWLGQHGGDVMVEVVAVLGSALIPSFPVSPTSLRSDQVPY